LVLFVEQPIAGVLGHVPVLVAVTSIALDRTDGCVPGLLTVAVVRVLVRVEGFLADAAEAIDTNAECRRSGPSS
jgi:hypothetical protein